MEAYDLPLHIGSVFILLGVSLLGTLAPVVVRLSSRRPAVAAALRLGSFFGKQQVLICGCGQSRLLTQGMRA